MTYHELNQKANALATYLKEIGVGPEVHVGVFMKKSMELVVALLAILKAGGAYLPIHLASPQNRLQFILNDAQAKVLLTNMDLDPLNDFSGHILSLKDDSYFLNNDLPNPNIAVKPENLAYIIFTSGSTGQPKGVMINHYSIVNFLWSMRHSPGMDESTITLALASVSFDISTLEIFLPLIVGAKVVLASEEMNTNPLLLTETLDTHKVNFFQATPATWRLLLDTDWAGRADLKALCGGDMLNRKMANQILEKVGSLWNVYGPTETTVWATCGQIKQDDSPITIGKPIANVQIYILDHHLQPVPIGVTGEIHIAGEGLGRAYINKPQLTQERFIPSVFKPNTDQRMYKTGDLARYLPDGSIEILGRKDHQVKVQGYRVELGEINAVLSQHPSVNDSIVIAQTEPGGEKKLIAFFVPKDNFKPETTELRTFLGTRLPNYMIPFFFVKMDVFPLSPNGKVDRKALLIPEEITNHPNYVAPRNEKEEIMVQIWKSVLGIERIGVHDNFFELGGASIQSIQVVTKANMYGYKISVEHLFAHQTIAEIVEFMKDSSSAS